MKSAFSLSVVKYMAFRFFGVRENIRLVIDFLQNSSCAENSLNA